MKLFEKCNLKDRREGLALRKETKIAKKLFERENCHPERAREGSGSEMFETRSFAGTLRMTSLSPLPFLFASLRSLRLLCFPASVNQSSQTHLPALLLAATILTGCSTPPTKLGKWEGPPAATRFTTSDTDIVPHGQLLQTPHYSIHTTLVSDDFRARVAQVMEGAYAEYAKVVPGVPLSTRPMDCFIFQSRPEWNDFTRDNTGVDSKIYLQINRGGYTLHDWYVAYYIGDLATLSVASHEGWHQFVARNFKGRIPPFLEEGIATTFESIHFDNGLPRWNRNINPNRAQALRVAFDGRRMWPLEQVVAMHAGQIVDKSGDRISAFYSQAWAFARFLQDADNAKYRPAFQRLLRDTAAGGVEDATGGHVNLRMGWNPTVIKPILEHYLNMPWEEIDNRYQAYVRLIAHEEFASQFAS